MKKDDHSQEANCRGLAAEAETRPARRLSCNRLEQLIQQVAATTNSQHRVALKLARSSRDRLRISEIAQRTVDGPVSLRTTFSADELNDWLRVIDAAARASRKSRSAVRSQALSAYTNLRRR